MSRLRPIGFRVLAVFAAFYALIAIGVALTSWHAWERGEQGLLAVMAVVTAEALWNARPWSFRASVAFAASFYLALLLESFLIGFNAVPLGVSIVFVAPMLGYVGSRTAKLRAPPPPPVLRRAP